MVALVGPSDAGKTTVSYLALRFFDPASGIVKFDGRDLRDIRLVSLDSITERSIRDALASMRSGESRPTTIVIAHRLSTILSADKILVLDEGRCVDSGRHSELLERCALYRRLYDEQFAPQDAVANC